MVAAILGKPARFFGFKWRYSAKKYVAGLFSYISEITSETYIKICALAGRPTLFDIARKAAQVVQEQFIENVSQEASDGNFRLRRRKSKFETKLQAFISSYDQSYCDTPAPRETELFLAISRCKTNRERDVFVRLITDNLFYAHLTSKGYALESVKCRLCPLENNNVETFAHVAEHLVLNPGLVCNFSAGLKRKIQKF